MYSCLLSCVPQIDEMIRLACPQTCEERARYQSVHYTHVIAAHLIHFITSHGKDSIDMMHISFFLIQQANVSCTQWLGIISHLCGSISIQTHDLRSEKYFWNLATLHDHMIDVQITHFEMMTSYECVLNHLSITWLQSNHLHTEIYCGHLHPWTMRRCCWNTFVKIYLSWLIHAVHIDIFYYIHHQTNSILYHNLLPQQHTPLKFESLGLISRLVLLIKNDYSFITVVSWSLTETGDVDTTVAVHLYDGPGMNCPPLPGRLSSTNQVYLMIDAYNNSVDFISIVIGLRAPQIFHNWLELYNSSEFQVTYYVMQIL